jgi:hypothetical protein
VLPLLLRSILVIAVHISLLSFGEPLVETNLQWTQFNLNVLNDLWWQIVEDVLLHSTKDEWQYLSVKSFHCQHTHLLIA